MVFFSSWPANTHTAERVKMYSQHFSYASLKRSCIYLRRIWLPHTTSRILVLIQAYKVGKCQQLIYISQAQQCSWVVSPKPQSHTSPNEISFKKPKAKNEKHHKPTLIADCLEMLNMCHSQHPSVKDGQQQPCLTSKLHPDGNCQIWRVTARTTNQWRAPDLHKWKQCMSHI